MRFFLLMLLGIAAYGGAFVKISIGGLQIVYICILCLCISYSYYFMSKGRHVKLTDVDKALLYFVAYGLLRVAMSLAGTTDFLISDELYVNKLYTFRQAYYLFFIPAITVLSNTKYIGQFQDILNRYNGTVFSLIYIINLVVTRQFAIGVPTSLFLAYLVLIRDEKGVIKDIMALMVIFTPIAIGGEMTNLLIRLIFVLYLLVNERNNTKLTRMLSMGVQVGIALTFILPLFEPLLNGIFDANSFWRLQYWHDELTQLAHSRFLGVGFGTSFASNSFVGSVGSASGPFAASAEYSTLDKLFVTGPHSSFVAVAFRLGIIGLILITWALWKMDNNLKDFNISVASKFLFFAAIVIISTNVGLESPYYLAFFVFSVSSSLYETKIKLGYNNFEAKKRKITSRRYRITWGKQKL